MYAFECFLDYCRKREGSFNIVDTKMTDLYQLQNSHVQQNQLFKRSNVGGNVYEGGALIMLNTVCECVVVSCWFSMFSFAENVQLFSYISTLDNSKFVCHLSTHTNMSSTFFCLATHQVGRTFLDLQFELESTVCSTGKVISS